MADFSRGLIDSRPLVWYASMTVFVLFLNLQVFQYRKWKA
jgi:ABC-2 type transport system permease protein